MNAAGADVVPAGGADIGEALVASAGALAVTLLMLAVVLGHRSGRLPQVARLAAFAERASGLPGWAALPLLFVAGALLVAVVGMYWDISIHIDEGRDEGPLANVAHYFILAGIFGVFFAGLLAMGLPKAGRPSAMAVRLAGDWHAPLGGVLMTLSAAFALGAFPLDDVWHRLFGQDVTLWGPTHLLLVGGAGLATVGALVLACEGLTARTAPPRPSQRRWLRLRQAGLAGAFLIALSTFQAEFDFAVPQFRLVWHPMLLMLAAGIGLVTARMLIGRGGALLALAVYLAVRAGLSLFVGPITGHTAPHFPLYIAEALVVEAVAARVPADRPVKLGLLAGIGIGTVGLAAEWAWSHVGWTIPWTEALVPEGIVAGVLAGAAAGLLGGWIGAALRAPEAAPRREPRWPVPLAAATFVALAAFALQMDAGPPARAHIALEEVTPAPERRVAARVRLEPRDAADGAEWLTVTAWQGGGSVVDPLRRTGPGEYETTRAIPVHGNWKAMLRLQNDRTMAGVPIFMPRDDGIPAAEIPAEPALRRGFVLDQRNLQRERRPGVSQALVTAAYLGVLAVALALLGSLAWGLARFARLSRKESSAPSGPREESSPEDRQAPVRGERVERVLHGARN